MSRSFHRCMTDHACANLQAQVKRYRLLVTILEQWASKDKPIAADHVRALCKMMKPFRGSPDEPAG